MTTQEVARRLVELCRQGENLKAYDELFHKDAVAVEPENIPDNEARGLDKLRAKTREWGEDLKEMHSMEISDPLVADDFFSCTMKMDITTKSRGREQMDELCVYEVKNGKIVKERFFYHAQMAEA